LARVFRLTWPGPALALAVTTAAMVLAARVASKRPHRPPRVSIEPAQLIADGTKPPPDDRA